VCCNVIEVDAGGDLTAIISCGASVRDGTETGDNKTRTLDWKISWSCVTATTCLPEPLVNAVVTVSILRCMSCDVRCNLPSPMNTAMMIDVTCRISEQAKQAKFSLAWGSIRLVHD